MDSAAEETVCPDNWKTMFGTRKMEDGREIKFVNASGGRMIHFGARNDIQGE